ncbi:hypothetical protein PILCRDRAFT_814269 [Piloderma croceum F 1598]|uniref:Uncharacterized protein n=1 Tax=Piloderma croceum (strain F 1598) TaxID=765440 RepID=A0A0C3GCK1_PILCF|nr:hypothetical protein PILCRDRAFT_814269 [Piloderma croceum F 1598]
MDFLFIVLKEMILSTLETSLFGSSSPLSLYRFRFNDMDLKTLQYTVLADRSKIFQILISDMIPYNPFKVDVCQL